MPSSPVLSPGPLFLSQIQTIKFVRSVKKGVNSDLGFIAQRQREGVREVGYTSN